MEIPKILKSFNNLELILLSCFIIYIVFPISTPPFLAGFIESSLGMLLLFLVTIFLFFYTNPILGVIFVFVAYELLRRSSHLIGKAAIIQHTPSQLKKDLEMSSMNPPKRETLEEEMVEKMAPVGKSDMSIYTPSSFKPVAESVGSASLV
jgi:MFS superfamily sulfate permease-like transporter